MATKLQQCLSPGCGRLATDETGRCARCLEAIRLAGLTGDVAEERFLDTQRCIPLLPPMWGTIACSEPDCERGAYHMTAPDDKPRCRQHLARYIQRWRGQERRERAVRLALLVLCGVALVVLMRWLGAS